MKNSGVLKACVNLTSAFLGIGQLTVPYALSSRGWLSLGLFFVVAAMMFYTGVLIKQCLDQDPSVTNYLQIAEKAFGNKGRVIVSVIMNMELYLVGIGLVVLEADNLRNLFPNFAIKVGSVDIGANRSFMIITGLMILPTMLLTDVSRLSYVTATGVFSCLVIFISILCVGLSNDGARFKAKGSGLINVSGLPTALSLYIACFGGHPVLPSIYISMKNANKFNKVLLSTFAITSITYLCTAVIGYLIFGEKVEVQITLNLPRHKLSAKVAIYTTLLIPVTRYALLLAPVANSIEAALPKHYPNMMPVKLVIRLALLITTVILACVFPFYKTLMSIVGSIFIVSASILLPCLFQVKIFGNYRKLSYKNLSLAGIVLFGVTAGVVGTYSSISEIVREV